MKPYQRPNFKLYYDGYEPDVSYTLSCEGLIDEPDCRLGMLDAKQRAHIEEAMEFIGQLYEPRFSPDWVDAKIGFERASGARLVFDSIELRFRPFVRRYIKRLTKSELDRLSEAGFNPVLLISPTVAYREIWCAFYGDVAQKAVTTSFFNAVDFVLDTINEEDI